MVEKRAHRPGGVSDRGKPRSGAGGKGSVLSANISDEARAYLDRRAYETGFSVSRVADNCIVDCARGEETFPKKHNLQPRVADAINRIASVVSDISNVSDDPTWEHFLIIAAIEQAAAWAMGPAPSSGRLAAQLKANEKAITSLEAVATAIADANDPAINKAADEVVERLGRYPIRSMFADHAHELMRDGKFAEITAALEYLSELPGKVAKTQVDSALDVIRSIHDDDAKEAAEYDRLQRRAREVVEATYARFEPPPAPSLFNA